MEEQQSSINETCSNAVYFAWYSTPAVYGITVLLVACTAHVQPLLYVLNAATRLVFNECMYNHVTANILPVQHRIEYKVCGFIYQFLHELAPAYRPNMCVQVSALEQ